MATSKKTSSKARPKQEPRLIIRNATMVDVEEILQLTRRVYQGMPPYPADMLRGQINHFPEGHFVAVVDGKIVGYCATIRVQEDKALKAHTWREITGGGFGSTHEANGDMLYGYEVCVDPDYQKLKIGQRFYNERKKLCRYLRTKGIVFAGRLPKLREQIEKAGSPENYVSMVMKRKLRDPVLEFQRRNGFELLGVLKNYLPSDVASGGYAAHMIWRNPSFEAPPEGPRKTIANAIGAIRVATVQYGQRRIKSFKEFAKIVEYFVDIVGDYKADFVCFPELFTLQLLSIDNEPVKPHVAIEKMDRYTKPIKELFAKLAVKYNVNIIAGSHPVKRGEVVNNISFVFLRDGRIYEQGKIHPTPNERYWWNIEGTSSLAAIPTDCGPIGVLICYDSEFPELTRHLVNQGIRILFVPFLTDERQAYYRVRYCSQARAVENQIYVVMSGSVGNLPNVQNIDIHYSQSCILTPCDFPFARDGIAAETTANVETVSFADLRIDELIEARSNGTVLNLKDRRHDLYSVKWHEKES